MGHKGFWGEMTLNSTVMMNTCHCTFVKTYRTCHAKSEPDVNHRLQVILTRLCRFIACDKRALWWAMWTVGEAAPVWGWAVNGKALYLPLDFAVNLKLI